MKVLLLSLSLVFAAIVPAQETFKSKNLKIKYTPPEGWSVTEFGGKSPWEESGNAFCECSGAAFFKLHTNGNLNVLVYPSTASGLDSTKRNFAGNLRFENVIKYDKTKNKFFSFERKRSNFTDTQTNKKSHEVIRYLAKAEDHFYIIYAWQENMISISPDIEKELYKVVNSIEPY